jgi:hypothetical protein
LLGARWDPHVDGGAPPWGALYPKRPAQACGALHQRLEDCELIDGGFAASTRLF